MEKQNASESIRQKLESMMQELLSINIEPTQLLDELSRFTVHTKKDWQLFVGMVIGKYSRFIDGEGLLVETPGMIEMAHDLQLQLEVLNTEGGREMRLELERLLLRGFSLLQNEICEIKNKQLNGGN